MNRPCRIYFHEDTYPHRLPERYLGNIEESGALLVQNAFPIDFAPSILRTRVGGTKSEDPIDFPLDSISHIEWFYGNYVPDPLTPWVEPPSKKTDRKRN